MMVTAHQLIQWAEQLHWPSLAAAFVLGVIITVLLHLLYRDNLQRRLLILSLRFEQAEKEGQSTGSELQRLRAERNQLAKECRELDIDNAGLQTACNLMRQQIEERSLLLAETRKQIDQDFQLLAGKIMGEQGDVLSRQHESVLTGLLRPFAVQLQEFKQRVEAISERESRDRVAMTKEIEHLKRLNQQISADAINLTEALRGKNKLQGQWGEMVLSKLLEASGLRQGREFETQVHFKTEDGSGVQPDVLVHLPDNRIIIIDAKVSLKSYIAAHEETDAERRKMHTAQHLDSIKKHVNGLAGKQYHHLAGPGSLDFVLLFIPIEGAFQLAVEHDAGILVGAMNKKVIVASPSTLLAILRTISHIWRMDEQNRNSLVIAKQAGNLYDKFVGFAEAFEDIGLRLNQSQQAWHTARNRLTTGQGNLLARTEALKQLGVQPSKELPASLRQTSSFQGESS